MGRRSGRRSARRSVRFNLGHKRSRRHSGLQGLQGMQGGAFCEPGIRKYANLLVACVFLYVYFSKKYMKQEADVVMEFAYEFLNIGENMETVIKFLIQLVKVNWSQTDSMAFASDTALTLIQVPKTLRAVMNLAGQKYIFQFFAFSLCTFLSSTLKIINFTISHPRLAAFIGALTAAGSAAAIQAVMQKYEKNY